MSQLPVTGSHEACVAVGCSVPLVAAQLMEMVCGAATVPSVMVYV
jgi:hypothetical protein